MTGKAPSFIEPMKAKLVEYPTSGEWLYEIKFDGFRAIAVKDGETVKLYSRSQNNLGPRFPSIAAVIARIAASDAIIDGEIVALDPKGRSSFQLLQSSNLGENVRR